MLKKYFIPAGALFCVLFLLAINSDRISYGVLYIENKTDWDLKVTAKVKDEWDVVTQTDWDIPAQGAEKIDNLSKLSNIRFKPDIDDDSATADWLKRLQTLELKSHEPAKDLIVTISKDPYADRWKTAQLYVSSAKIEYGGATGYHVKILAR
jgi:hypothetical protein